MIIETLQHERCSGFPVGDVRTGSIEYLVESMPGELFLVKKGGNGFDVWAVDEVKEPESTSDAPPPTVKTQKGKKKVGK